MLNTLGMTTRKPGRLAGGLEALLAKPTTAEEARATRQREDAERLRLIYDDLVKVSQAEFGAQTGIGSQSMVWQYLSGKRPLNVSVASKFAKGLNVPVKAFSPFWAAEIDRLFGLNAAGAKQRENEQQSSLTPIFAWDHPDDLPEGEYVQIPRLEVHLSAGSGREQLEIEFVKLQPQAFRAEWIRRKRLKPNMLACMYASGDSMEDRIFDGDSLVIDTSDTTVVDGRVYALWYDGGERVKRLYRRPGGGLLIRSDNERKYPEILLSAEEAEHVRVIGRVVQVSGDKGL